MFFSTLCQDKNRPKFHEKIDWLKETDRNSYLAEMTELIKNLFGFVGYFRDLSSCGQSMGKLEVVINPVEFWDGIYLSLLTLLSCHLSKPIYFLDFLIQ